MKQAYVFLNGELQSDPNFVKTILQKEEGDIFCVDGGSRYLYELGIVPLELWGDLDSASPSLVQDWKEKNCIIHQFPIEKDFTDFELLLQSLANRNYEKIIVFAGLGGNTDHFLANINLCFQYPQIEFLTEKEHIFLAPKHYHFVNKKGQKISFVPMSEKIISLSLQGFQYNLDCQSLSRGDSLCHGNCIVEDFATLSFQEGELLVVMKQNLNKSDSNK